MVYNFSWVLPGRLAGCGLAPLAGGVTAEQVEYLRREGIGALVSLVEQPQCLAAAEDAGLRCLHLPVPDMEPPTRDQIDRFVEFADGAAQDGLSTAVHCRAGLGRTGTLLACYLVHRGATAQEALRQVRQERPGSVETAAQEESISLYAGSLARRRRALRV